MQKRKKLSRHCRKLWMSCRKRFRGWFSSNKRFSKLYCPNKDNCKNLWAVQAQIPKMIRRELKNWRFSRDSFQIQSNVDSIHHIPSQHSNPPQWRKNTVNKCQKQAVLSIWKSLSEVQQHQLINQVTSNCPNRKIESDRFNRVLWHGDKWRIILRFERNSEILGAMSSNLIGFNTILLLAHQFKKIKFSNSLIFAI